MGNTERGDREMNLYLALVACQVLIERIERNKKVLKGTSDPVVVQVLQDEIKACRYAIEYLEGGKIYESD